MRGQLVIKVQGILIRRITPADAGTTRSFLSESLFGWDHPRGCGDNLKGGLSCRQFIGSPPRMRGQRSIQRIGQVDHGITPADAGTTILFPFIRVVSRDHPRGCGDNRPVIIRPSSDGGSPPRMRGQPLYEHPISDTLGITPADAGTTCCFARFTVSL